MKTNLFRSFALAAVALGLGGMNLSAATPVNPTLPLQQVLKLKGRKAMVFQPFVIKPEQTFLVTHLQFGDGSVRPEGRRAVQLVIYDSTPNVDGTYNVLHSATHLLDRTQDVVNVFPSYTHPQGAEPRGIIAVLIGLLLPAVQTADVTPTGAPVPVPLPADDTLTAELHDPGTGIGLLVPAVQKVREAAAR